MAERVNIPIRVRTDPAALETRPEELDGALSAATVRALDQAHRQTGGAPAVFHAPTFAWMGAGVSQLSPSQRAGVQQRVTAQVGQSVQTAQGRGTIGGPGRRGASAPGPRGRRRSAGVGAGRRPWRGWRNLQVSQFPTTVGEYASYVTEVAVDDPRDYWSLYADMESEIRWVSVWYVRADRAYRRNDLIRELGERAAELAHVRNDQDGLWSIIFSEPNRQSLIAIDHTHSVVESVIPDLSANPSASLEMRHGEIYVSRGGHAGFTFMVLPVIEFRTFARTGTELAISLPYRDLEFLVNRDGFQSFFDVPFAGFLAEAGDQLGILRIFPWEVTRPVSSFTLEALAEQTLQFPSGENSRLLREFKLLNQATIDALPNSIRPAVTALTNSVTLARDSADLWGRWQAGWCGAEFSAAFQVTPDLKFAIDNRATARDAASRFVAHLGRYRAAMDRGYPDDLLWWFAMKDLLQASFVTYPGAEGVRRMFDLVMEELERRDNGRWFGFLLDCLGTSSGDATQYFIQAATVSARYANHPRIVALRDRYNAGFRSALNHTYYPGVSVWLMHNADRRVPLGGVVANWYADYKSQRSVKNLKEAKRAAFEAALATAANGLLDDIVNGRVSRDFNQDEFANEAITRAARQIGLTNDDFEDAIEYTSLRVQDVTARSDAGLERYEVAVVFVKKIDDGPWRDVEGSAVTLSELRFEEIL